MALFSSTQESLKQRQIILPLLLEFRIASLVDYFNELFKVDLAGPSLSLRDEENVEEFPLAFSDGIIYRASPGVQHIPAVTHHYVAFQIC
jgi:hypothetical protein